jgi:hypothetical protein
MRSLGSAARLTIARHGRLRSDRGLSPSVPAPDEKSFSCWYHRQAEDCPYARSAAPSNLCRLNREAEFRPARVQSFERVFAFKARELMTKAEMDACAEGNVAVRPARQIELFGRYICRRIHVGGLQHGYDLVSAFEPDAA